MKSVEFRSTALLWFGFCIVSLALTGCARDQQAKDKPSADEDRTQASKPSDSLALVNGSPVTQSELDLAIERTLGETAALYMNDELAKKILDSLVSSRVIAQKAVAEMSADEKQWLDLKAAAYKEELLVKYYLEKNVTPEPVTNEMVKNYYQSNPEKFGGGTLKIFEYVQVSLPKELISADLNVSSLLSELTQKNNWKSASVDLQQSHKDWVVVHRQGELQAGQLKEPLQGMLKDLKVRAVAPVQQQGKTFTVLRLNSESSIPAKPLAVVSAEIRKSLAPLQLKKAVKAISKQVLDESKVKYLNGADQ